MYLLIIFLPLIGAMFAGFGGRFIGTFGAIQITVGNLFLTFFFSCCALYEIITQQDVVYINLVTWLNSEMLYTNWGFLYDSLTILMLIVVTCISLLVHIYSIEYMAEDPHKNRFFSYLSFFTFCMIILVTADNFLQMFVGWEAVGLCSYLLINFWFSRLQANKAAIKAMVVNRIGDFGLALGIFAIFYLFKSVEYSSVFALTPLYLNSTLTFLNIEINALTLICFLLFIGAIGKSAQVGLHVWLPDAMEAPTPVSALIHAATMVTAGVFLLARCSPLFEFAPITLIIITIIGAITSFIAATTGLLQNDLKKVIAYSTCSQLGYMIFVCGISNYTVGIFHLANHAFFKALLFLAAGSVIHAMANEQDLRKMGGLIKILPSSYAMILIGSLSLMGTPFLTGFYSKDVILELAYAKFTIASHFAYLLGTSAAFCTAFYSMRLIYLVFLTKTNAYKRVIQNAHDAPFLMTFPLIILSFGSVFIGYLTKDMVIGLGTNFFGNSIFCLPNNIILVEAEFIPHSIKLLPVFFSLLGTISTFVFYTFYQEFLFKLKTKATMLYIFLNKKWLFDKVYNDFISQNILHVGYHSTYKIIDRGIIEIVGPFGLSQLVYKKSYEISQLQTGFLFHYTFVILIGTTILLTIFLYLNVIDFNIFFVQNDFRIIFILLAALFFK
jgi:NADH-ubiquinone oxidoreductase chain 5